ncbi:kinase-like domain-containing protein [Aspergillus unguis]
MRESLALYQRRFKDRRVPLPLVKTYIRVLLTGLDYLHTTCRTVHTDLKLENIMVAFEDQSVLADFMDSRFEPEHGHYQDHQLKPVPYKIDKTGRPIYQSCTDFGPLKSLRSIPQFVDFGSALRLPEDDDWGFWAIQADHYRAPEVILGNGWQFPADIWNFGVLLWDLISGKELFCHIHDDQGRYDPRRHIAEMIALLGPPPPEIIQRYQYMQGYAWPEPVRREDGKVCETSEDYFDGPFFDDNGRFLYEDLIPNRKLEDTVPSFLEGEEKESFLDLARNMLIWHPDYRKRAGELAEHPFLQGKKTRI